jgi:uncharacterized protein YdaU (DUF1376 family)
MAKNPVFPLYYNDLNGSCDTWTDEEYGAYMRLLIHQWDKGFIPSDMKRLNKIADSAEQNWPLLSEKFPAGADGKFRNIRLEEIREEKKKHSDKQKDNIRKRYQTSTKPSSKENTKKIPLEDEYEEEKEVLGNEGSGEREQVDDSTYIVPRMFTVWKSEFPKYAINQENDWPALHDIALQLCDYLAVPKTFQYAETTNPLENLWRELVTHIKSNKHFSTYQLSQVLKYLQSILQSFNQPKEPDKTAIQYLYDRFCEEPKAIHKTVSEGHYDELHAAGLIEVDEKLIDQVRKTRLQALQSPMNAEERMLHELYAKGEPCPELEQDHQRIILKAKKTAVINFFKRQKEAKATNVLIVKK